LSENEVVGTVAIKNIGNANAMLRKMFVKECIEAKTRCIGQITCSIIELGW
jgi:hypothetical protein